MKHIQRSMTAFLAGPAAIALTMTLLPVDANAITPYERSHKRTVTILGLLPDGTSSRATDINDRGVIVGYGDTTDGVEHAIRWSPRGRITDLGGLPGGHYSRALGINNHGDIVGYAGAADGNDHAVRWAPDGTVTDIGGLPGYLNIFAYGINDRGSVVGAVRINSTTYHAVIWRTDGTVSDIGTNSPWPGTSAVAINNHNTVVGKTAAKYPGRDTRAVTWPARGTEPIVLSALPGGDFRGIAQDINDKGMIVGESGVARTAIGAPPVPPYHATLWSLDSSTPTDLGTLSSGRVSYASGINAAGGVIVGYSGSNSPDEDGAVLWLRRKNGWHIEPLPHLPGAGYSSATAINNKGVVVGESTASSYLMVAVRWQ